MKTTPDNKAIMTMDILDGEKELEEELEQLPFEMCQYTKDKICPVVREIEKNEWQNYSELNGMGEGEEKLDKLLSYMVCLTGCGVIYFIDSGQIQKQFADAYSIINKVVNEQTLMNMGWKVEKFEEVYGPDAIGKLKQYMYEYKIIEPNSICMFLGTLGRESGNGTDLIEKGYKKNLLYEEKSKGAGLIQVTGNEQRDFLLYIYDKLEEEDPMKGVVKQYLDW